MLDFNALNASLVYPEDILHWAANAYRRAAGGRDQLPDHRDRDAAHAPRTGLAVDVLTLDTGLLFPETYDLMNRLAGAA